MRRYILDGRRPVLCEDPLMWAKWFKNADRRILDAAVGDFTVTTMFRGLDFADYGKPQVFQTDIYDPDRWPISRFMNSSWEGAIAQNEAACAMLQYWAIKANEMLDQCISVYRRPKASQ